MSISFVCIILCSMSIYLTSDMYQALGVSHRQATAASHGLHLEKLREPRGAAKGKIMIIAGYFF